jgi:hypothetical protein
MNSFYIGGRRLFMTEIQDPGLQRPTNEERTPPAPEETPARAIGSPLPIGSGHMPQGGLGDPLRPFTPPPPGRALVNTNTSMTTGPIDMPTGVQRTLNAIRAALPWVQKILPLLDGNIGSAVSNILAPHHHPQAPAPPPANLARLEEGLAEILKENTDLQTQHKELRGAIQEQNASLKRVEDQLEMVREATDRNTLEQQELMEDLKVVGNKVNMFAAVALGLLGLSVLLNIFLYLHIMRVLP